MDKIIKQVYNMLFQQKKENKIFKKPDAYKNINSNSLLKLNN